MALVVFVRAFLLSLALVAAGCGGGGDESAAPATTGTPTSTQAAPPPRHSPDEHFGYIRSISTAGPVATLAFDEAEWLSGDDAQKAAEEDGAVAPGEPVSNDYYIQNRDKTSRTLRIANDAKITTFRCDPCRDGIPRKLGAFLAAFNSAGGSLLAPYRGKHSQYWLTIENGEVVAIDEQYVP